MFAIFRQILCWVTAIAAAVLWAIMTAVNAIIAGIGAGILAIISLLPNMPTAPTWTGVTSDVFGYANWAFPVGFLVTAIASLAVLYLAWQAVAAILRFGKAVQ